MSFSASVAVGHREGLIADRTAEFVRAARRPPGRAGRQAWPTAPTTASATSGCARCTAATCCGTRSPARSSRPRSTSCCGSPPASPRTTRPRALDEVAALYRLMSRLDYLPSSPTLFNSGTRHPQMSSCYLLDSPLDELDSIYDRYHQVARLSKHAGRHRPVVLPDPLPRFADPRHQRALQRHRPVPEDPRRLGRRGEPGRPAQGRGRGLPGDLARRHRGVPGAARQHRRGGPAYPQPQPRALDPGRVHAPGRTRTPTGRCSPPPTCPSWSTCGATSSTPPTARPRPRAWPSRPSGPRAVRPDDAHPRADRQRLDDLQGRRQPHRQPDRRSRAAPSTPPTCAPRSWRSPTTARPRSATSARSTSARS